MANASPRLSSMAHCLSLFQNHIVSLRAGVKIGLAAAHFHSVGVARAGPWNTWVNKGKRKRKQLSSKSRGKIVRIPPRSTMFEDGVEDR